MQKSTKKRIRNVVLGISSVALVASITASLTLAYLTDKDGITNVFTGSPNISALLLEPNWDGDTDGDNNGKQLDENPGIDEPTNNDGWGVEKAKNYMPGDVINKNPYVKNTSEKKEYVMLQVTYKVNGAIVSKENFNKYAETYYDESNVTNSNWTIYDNKTEGVEYYVYGTSTENKDLTLIDKDGQTEELFKTVNIKTTLTNDDYENGTLPQLDIDLKAAVVSPTEGETLEDDATYASLLKSLFEAAN